MKKFTKKIVYYRIITYLFGVIVFFQMFVVNFTSDLVDEAGNPIPITELYDVLITFGIIAFVVWLFLMVYSYLFYKTSGYQLTDNEIICQRGVLFKKKSVIEYKKIHAVNQKHGIIQRMFGISVLLVDSGSTNTAMNAEIMIYEDRDVVDELYHRLKNLDLTEEEIKKEVEEKPQEFLYEFSSKSKVIYSALNMGAGLIGIFFAGVFIVALLGIIGYFSQEEIDLMVVIIIAIAIYLIINAVIFISNCVYSFVSLYDFKVTKEKNSLNINHGLLTRVNNTFKLDRIKGVKIEQGLVKRLFGFATVKLEVIGYNHSSNDNNNDRNQSLGMLIPLCKMAEVNDLITKILPDYTPLERYKKSKSLMAFILTPTALNTITFLSILIFVLPFFMLIDSTIEQLILTIILGCYVTVEMIILVYAFFAVKEQSINISEDKITVYSGAFGRLITVIKKENLIAIEDISTKCRAKRNIYSFKIHFHTNAMTNVVKVRMLDFETKEALLKMLKY